MSAAQPIHAPVQKPEIVVPPPKPAKPSSGRPLKKWLILLLVLVIVGWCNVLAENGSGGGYATAAFASIRTAKVTSGYARALDSHQRTNGRDRLC